MYEEKLVYSYEMANYLMSLGFKMKRIEQNRKFADKLVFFFEYESGIEEKVKSYKKVT